MSGASARSGASAASASAAGPAKAPSTITNWPPRIGSGIIGSSGTDSSRSEVVSASGATAVTSRHTGRTSAARSSGKNIAPAVSSGSANRRNSIAVTTPKLPPPPRTAQNRSGSVSASTRRSTPSAVTMSTARTASAARPCLRPSQLMPPPRE